MFHYITLYLEYYIHHILHCIALLILYCSNLNFVILFYKMNLYYILFIVFYSIYDWF